MQKVAGVTVLYHPDEEMIFNILSYLNQVELLYIVDNSETNSRVVDVLKSNLKIKLIDNSGNIGMAAAINKAVEQAVQNGFGFLLTMDQDSRISDNLVYEMLKEFERDDKIGVISPFVVHAVNPKKPVNFNAEEITVAMTSGCLLKLSALIKVGGFLEKYFIDYVDNELCLRMHLYGFKVLVLNSVKVYHKLGAPECRRFFFIKVYPTNHSPLRWYYRTRNRFSLYKEYKKKFSSYVRTDKKAFLKELVKLILYESEKLKKIRMIITGYLDFRRNKFGALN